MDRPNAKEIVSTVSVPKNVTREYIETIVTTAFEGGSNYWIDRIERIEPSKEEFIGYAIAYDEISVKIRTEDTDTWHILTIDDIIKGISMYVEKFEKFPDIMEIDGEVADCILQFSLFERIVFG